MSLIEDIQDAQIKAGEDVVCKNLDKLGLDGLGGVTRRMTPNEKLYDELIMAVESKFPDESRHETALRYIKERENRNNPPAANQS